MRQVVTVGLDGSPESLTAADWAAGEARLRGAPLRLVHAWVMLPPTAAGVPEGDVQSHWARRIVRDAAEAVRERHPGLTVQEDLLAEEPVEALLAESALSPLLAVGSRGIGPVAHFFLGDIALDVVARSTGPVALVRVGGGGAGKPRFPDGGDVVVGLRLHRPCEELFEFAFAAAERRGAALRAIHSRTLPAQSYAPWGVDPDAARDLADEVAGELRRAMGPWRKRFPGVRAIEDIALESPARAVVRSAKGAGLLVLGRRRKGPALVPRIGPVVHAALHHADCPVVVVPHD